LAVGVTVTVATIFDEVALVAVNTGITPLPEAASPIEGVVFDQAKVLPVTGPDGDVRPEAEPLQYCWAAILFTVGVGKTVTV